MFELSEPTTLSLTTSDLKDISCYGLTDGLVELEAQGIQGASVNYSITHQSTNITNNEILYQFTNAGQNGRIGPYQEQINSAYSGTSLEDKVISDDGIQSFVVEETGNYLIQAYGAEGGNGRSKHTSYESYKGGKGQ